MPPWKVSMVDDKDKTVVATPEAQDKPAETGGKKRLFLFAGIGAGILVLGVALAIFVLKPMISGSGTEDASADKTAKVEKPEKAARAETEKPKPKKEGSSASSDGVMYAIKDIVVNPAGTGGSRFLSVSFGFELINQEAATRFEGKEPLVRDVLITILSSKTLADLTDPKQKEVMRLQIKKRLTQMLNSDELTGVYYTDFVLQ